MNIYYNNIYRKDLGQLHFNDTPGIPSVGKNISKHLLISNHHDTNQKQYAEMQNLLYFVSPNYSHLLCIEYIYHYGEFIIHPLQSGFNVVFIDFEQVLDHCIHEVILADIPKHRWEYFICIFYSLYILFYLFPKFQTNSQYRIQTFYGNSAFLKSGSEWFSDTRNPFMMEAGGPSIFDTRCTEGSIFVSLENIFLFLSIHGLSCLAFTQNVQRKNNGKTFFGSILGRPYKSSGNKTRLDAALAPH